MKIISILLKVGKAVYNKAKQIGKKVAVFAKKVGKGSLYHIDTSTQQTMLP